MGSGTGSSDCLAHIVKGGADGHGEKTCSLWKLINNQWWEGYLPGQRGLNRGGFLQLGKVERVMGQLFFSDLERRS